MDWINDKLYWTDAFHQRIEVINIDLDSPYRKTLVYTGAGTTPRAIVVDPTTR